MKPQEADVGECSGMTPERLDAPGTPVRPNEVPGRAAASVSNTP
jgi:hypothetical protein